MKRCRYLAGTTALALLIVSGLLLHHASRPEPLNIIFLTVESWRAESATPEHMPNLFRASTEGSRYVNHRAVSAWTGPNIIAVLTGLSPFEQGVHARGHSIDAARDVFLDRLTDRGWRVAGLQSFMAVDVFQNLGLNVTPKEDPFAWLSARVGEKQPFVLWHHYLRTHLPYAPSEKFRGRYQSLAADLDAEAKERLAVIQSASIIPAGSVAFEARDRPALNALYLGGVTEFDDWFGEFWDFFNQSGLRDTTILVVTADHGEELLERGNVGHASTNRAGHLHGEILRVPMLVWFPGNRKGTVVEAATDHKDIVPLLQKELGLAPVPESREPFVAVTSLAGYSEPNPSELSGFEAAVVQDGWKLRLHQVRNGKVVPHLHNMETDPGEIHDLAESEPDRVAAMSQVLLPKLLALWQEPKTDQPPSSDVEITRPQWTSPSESRIVRYADIADGARLQWTGDPSGHYAVEYRAGAGALTLNGTLDVKGTSKDFGTVGEFYWRTWVVPYKRIRLRVMPAGHKSLASEWVELRFAP
jgi:arylsulfatase A-like enzyme